jgi:hypothetical protein
MSLGFDEPYGSWHGPDGRKYMLVNAFAMPNPKGYGECQRCDLSSLRTRTLDDQDRIKAAQVCHKAPCAGAFLLDDNEGQAKTTYALMRMDAWEPPPNSEDE